MRRNPPIFFPPKHSVVTILLIPRKQVGLIFCLPWWLCFTRSLSCLVQWKPFPFLREQGSRGRVQRQAHLRAWWFPVERVSTWWRKPSWIRKWSYLRVIELMRGIRIETIAVTHASLLRSTRWMTELK